jgi:glycosyltransferase involved in cell wall biosynthesis
LLAVSQTVRDAFEDPDHCEVIHNGIEPSRINRRHDRQEIIDRLLLPAGKKFVLFASRFSIEKRPELLAPEMLHLPHEHHLLATGLHGSGQRLAITIARLLRIRNLRPLHDPANNQPGRYFTVSN